MRRLNSPRNPYFTHSNPALFLYAGPNTGCSFTYQWCFNPKRWPKARLVLIDNAGHAAINEMTERLT